MSDELALLKQQNDEMEEAIRLADEEIERKKKCIMKMDADVAVSQMNNSALKKKLANKLAEKKEAARLACRTVTNIAKAGINSVNAVSGMRSAHSPATPFAASNANARSVSAEPRSLDNNRRVRFSLEAKAIESGKKSETKRANAIAATAVPVNEPKMTVSSKKMRK